MKICEINEDFLVDDKGILREKAVYSAEQEQTKDTFSFKWRQIDTYSGEKINDNHKKWLREKYFANNDDMFNRVLPKGSVVLDAGCGVGMSIIDLLGEKLKDVHYVG
ncbi:MAG: hypothetical protein K2N34_16645, partial [Lachnospiraceae bacterium]|nr:hypothetical protein [Lachnospiraceae bacterium]